LRYDRYLCVWESRDYYIACHANGPNGTETFQLGAHCYDANKVFLATVWAHNGVVPAGWDPIQRRIGPNGDVAWPQGTRYCRPLISAGTKDETIYVDDVQFQQMKAAYSPGIRLMWGYRFYNTTETYNVAAWNNITGSDFTITLEEPGYIHYGYNMTTSNNGVRTYACQLRAAIDGASENFEGRLGSGIANEEKTVCHVSRSDAIEAAGVHTITFQIWVLGGIQTTRFVRGWAYYARAY